jgi:hypothetical protein
MALGAGLAGAGRGDFFFFSIRGAMTMSDNTPSALRRLTDAALEAHPEAPQEAARMLREGLPLLPGEPGDLESYIGAAQHVLLGHLDDAAALRAALDRAQGFADRDAGAAAALARGRLAIELLDDVRCASSLPAAEHIRAFFNAALACTRRGDWPAARERLAVAGTRADGGDAAAQRAYAAVANNVAGDIRFYFKPEHRRDAGRVDTMLDGAQRARLAWAKAGGWMETERADYQLAMCHAAAGQGGPAVSHAQACLAICEANAADAYERFFAFEALAHAHRAADQPGAAQLARERMAQCLAQVTAADDHAYAQTCLAKVDEALAS